MRTVGGNSRVRDKKHSYQEKESTQKLEIATAATLPRAPRGG